ncbi:hypothetical protein ACS0TY_006813 [Phlomoides rotata]
MNATHQEKTIISLIKSCTQKPHLFQLHSLLLRSSQFYNPTVFLYFLSRFAHPPLRDLSYCDRIFSEFPQPNISLYNTMIRTHSLNRDSAHKGFLLYQELVRSGISLNALTETVALKCCTKMGSFYHGILLMQREGISPGDQTFTAILSACSHSGLVNEGRTFFEAMSRDYGVTPNIHHYGCMVDILGRAGLLDEAYELIHSMRVKPDAAMWRTLLGACRIHRNVALGERVVEHLVELKAQEAGDYVLLSNIYSASGNSEKVMLEFEVSKLHNPNQDSNIFLIFCNLCLQ